MADIILHQQITINNETDLPVASEDYRGVIMIIKGGTLVADEVLICVKTALDAYAWETLSLL